MRERQPNKAEAEFAKQRRDSGFPVPRRRGWPDFWWTDRDGRLCVAEVKPNGSSSLKVSQYEMLCALLKSGITDVYVWIADDGLWIFDPEEWVLCEFNSTEHDGKQRYCYLLAHHAKRLNRRIVHAPDPQIYERAIQGRLHEYVASDRTGLPALPTGYRARNNLRYLVSTVLELQRILSGGRKGKWLSRDECRDTLTSLTWILDSLGAYPSQYNEILNRGSALTRPGSPRRTKSEPDGAEPRSDDQLARTQELWRRVREEEGL